VPLQHLAHLAHLLRGLRAIGRSRAGRRTPARGESSQGPSGSAISSFIRRGSRARLESRDVERESHTSSTAIMLTDIVGTALLSDGEQVTERITELVRSRVGEHGGDFVAQDSDETVSTFPTALGAVSCAVAIQRALRGEASLVLRIGVHLDDSSRGEPSRTAVVQRCAAIASTTAPGGVRMSAPVFGELQGRLRLRFNDLGEIPLRGIAQPTRVYAVHPGEGAEQSESVPVERRLAAVLKADVVSYSRLMATEEEWTVGAVKRHRATFARCIRERGGHVVDTSGDGILAEFPTALDAVECGVAMQREPREENADTPRERRIRYRVGIELGDIRSEAGRIYGSPVNIAARLEALAPAGGVCVSGPVWDQVRFQVPESFNNLGRQALKNIPYPVNAYALSSDETDAPPTHTRRRRIALIAAGVGLLAAAVGWIAQRG
jgi:class 3 adenylate cyclase